MKQVLKNLRSPQLFRTSLHFMQYEDSLPHSQESATCPYPEPDQFSLCPHPTTSRNVLILSTYLRLCLPSGVFLLYFLTGNLNTVSSFPHLLPAPTISFLIFFFNNILWKVLIMKPLFMQSYPILYYLITLRSRCPPQYPIRRHLQLMFLLQRKRLNLRACDRAS